MSNMDDSIKSYEGLVRRVITQHFPSKKYDDDVYQAGLIGLWKALKSEKEYENFPAFAAKCIKNEIIRELKKNVHTELVFQIEDGDRIYGAIEETDSIFKLVSISEYISGLDERNKIILEMTKQGKTIKEIAETLRVSVGKVHAELKQMKKDFKSLCY